jgi:hypothetical protein
LSSICDGAHHGRVVAESAGKAEPKDGMDIEKDRVSVGDLFATLYKGLGLDLTETKVRDNLGRPTSIADDKPISALLS